MLNNITGRPLWYKGWAFSVALASLYCLIKFCMVIATNLTIEATPVDYLLLAFIHLSILLKMYFFPEPNTEGQQEVTSD